MPALISPTHIDINYEIDRQEIINNIPASGSTRHRHRRITFYHYATVTLVTAARRKVRQWCGTPRGYTCLHVRRVASAECVGARKARARRERGKRRVKLRRVCQRGGAQRVSAGAPCAFLLSFFSSLLSSVQSAEFIFFTSVIVAGR